jgi:hypothetical protein
MKTKNPLLSAVALYASTLSTPVQAHFVNIVSNPNWTVADAGGIPIGFAQNVCLNASEPLNCPATSATYGYPYPGAWSADTSGIPGATWIWAPGITGATTPAANAEYKFYRRFQLCDTPQDGIVYLAADDAAEVFINGAPIPVLRASGTDVLSSAVIPASSLVHGVNTISVRAVNWPDPPDCAPSEYSCNPAGFILGAMIPGAREPTDMTQCITPPPPNTCTRTDGTRVLPKGVERLPCAAGKMGSRTRTCLADGIWGPFVDLCLPGLQRAPTNGL